MNLPESRRGRVLERLALALGAVVGALCLVAALAALVFDLRPLAFRSGSMAPTIHTGDLAVARTVPAAELAVGDIVSVKTASGSRVTHRMVAVTERGGHATLALKGDANSATDATTYDVDMADRVLFSVPKAGYVMAWLTGPLALFLLGGYVVWLLMRVLRPSGPGRSHPAGHVVTAVAMVGMVASSATPEEAPWTLASWTDDVGISGTTLAASMVPAPVVSCGTLGVGSVRLNWTAVPGATGYTLHYGTGGATTESVGSGITTKLFSGVATSGVFTVQANINYGSATWTSASSNAKAYTVILFVLGSCTNP